MLEGYKLGYTQADELRKEPSNFSRQLVTRVAWAAFALNLVACGGVEPPSYSPGVQGAITEGEIPVGGATIACGDIPDESFFFYQGNNPRIEHRGTNGDELDVVGNHWRCKDN